MYINPPKVEEIIQRVAVENVTESEVNKKIRESSMKYREKEIERFKQYQEKLLKEGKMGRSTMILNITPEQSERIRLSFLNSKTPGCLVENE